MRSAVRLVALVAALGLTGCALSRPGLRPVLTERSARWEHEAGLEGETETFGAESNPTGNPIGGVEGYTDVLTRGDCTVRTLDELREALKKATAGQVVFVPGDVEMDMSGQRPLAIPGGVAVASTRGLGGSEGSLIFSDKLHTPGLFTTAGDGVTMAEASVRSQPSMV